MSVTAASESHVDTVFALACVICAVVKSGKTDAKQPTSRVSSSMAGFVLNAMIKGWRGLRERSVRKRNDGTGWFLKQSREELLQGPISVCRLKVECDLVDMKLVEQVPNGPVLYPPRKRAATHRPTVNTENAAIRLSNQCADFTQGPILVLITCGQQKCAGLVHI